MSTHTAPDRFLERAGARLRWRLEGTGPVITLLHGWAMDLDYWNPLVERLAPRFTVLRFDRCGFGRSEGQPDIHRNVDDLRALLEAAGVSHTTLLGMSQGARLAIHFALRHVEQVQALVLDGAPALEAESELPLEHYRRLLQTAGPTALHTAILQHPLMQLHTDDPAIHRLLGDCVAGYTGRDLTQTIAPAQAPDLGVIQTPTLILNGGLDTPARRAAGHLLQQTIPGAQLAQLPHAGHLAQLDDPAGYAAAVSAFCAPANHRPQPAP